MTTQLIQSYYDAFNRRDYAGMLALVSDDVVHDVNQGEREVGKPRFDAFMKKMDTAYREKLENVVIMADASGTRFAAEFTVLGEYLQADPGFPAAHGQKYKLPAGAFLEVAGGKIKRITTYYNLQDWLAQVKQ